MGSVGRGEINPREVLPRRPVRVEKTCGGVLPPERAGVGHRAMRKLAQPNSIVCQSGHYPGVVFWVVTLNQNATDLVGDRGSQSADVGSHDGSSTRLGFHRNEPERFRVRGDNREVRGTEEIRQVLPRRRREESDFVENSEIACEVLQRRRPVQARAGRTSAHNGAYR